MNTQPNAVQHPGHTISHLKLQTAIEYAMNTAGHERARRRICADNEEMSSRIFLSGDDQTMYTLPPAYSYCQHSPCYSDGDDRIYKKKRTEITGKQRVAANERERKRMNSINRGFEHLRQRLPTTPQDKKLSKVDTLKGAMQYIRELQALLEQEHPNNQIGEHKLLVNNTPDGDTFYMVSWRRTPEKYGDIHATAKGPMVYQKNVWTPESK